MQEIIFIQLTSLQEDKFSICTTEIDLFKDGYIKLKSYNEGLHIKETYEQVKKLLILSGASIIA